MNSHFKWVDFAGENQRKMLDVVKMFDEKNTRDELGIGTIRDAFSDYFFPGTSTIQTRARYMLFVPWIYQRLENKKIKYPQIKQRARKEETKLIYALREAEDTEGLIGREAEGDLQRLPSEIYWGGLYSWGIRLFPGYQSQYHRSLTERYYNRKRSFGEKSKQSWDPGLPDPPDNLMEEAELSLRNNEAEYLLDRLSCSHNGSLLFFLVNSKEIIDADYFWQLPLIKNLPELLQENIRHARNFSETIHGASLLYNYLLSCQVDKEEWIEKYRRKINDWIQLVLSRWSNLNEWHQNLHNFWISEPLIAGQVSYSTRSFVEDWFHIIFNKDRLKNIRQSREAEYLLRNREVKLKRQRARLKNPRSLEMWGGASGTSRLAYRWNATVKTIVIDILNGLKREEKDSA